MGLKIENIVSNADLYKIATAKDTPGASLYSNFTSYEDFAKYAGAIDSAEARNLRNSFTTTAFAWYLDNIYVETAVNYLEEQGFGKKTIQSFYGMLQKMYIKTPDEVKPMFKNLEDGTAHSPWIVKKPKTEELFYTFNADYQNYVTIQDIEMKTAFASENGISEYVAGVLESMTAKFVEWELNKELDTINAAINSETYPLQDSQVVEVEMDNINETELVAFANTMKNIASSMTLKATGAFNAGGWKYRQKKEDLVLLIKPIYDNATSTYVLPYTFQKGIELEGIKKVYTDNFGGLIPTEDGTLDKKLTPIYDDEGRVTHTYKKKTGSATVDENDVVWYDPNEDIIAILIDKEAFFEIDQNPMTVEPSPYNPRTMAVNYFFNKANVGFHFDKQKNMVVVKKKQTQ